MADPSIPPSPSPSSRSACSSAGASATSSTSRSAAARRQARPSTSSTRARPPPTAAPAPTTCSRASSRTCSRATRPCAATTCHRKGGWDSHGLPVEIEVEKELGIKRKDDIEALRRSPSSTSSAASRCSRTSTSGTASPSGSASGSTPTTPTSRSTTTTSSRSGGRSSRSGSRGLLYEGYKVVPYCPRCGTALSSHEVALGYKDVVDPCVYVRFPLSGERARLAARLDHHALDAALERRARGAPGRHVRARAAWATRQLIVAEALVERVLGEDGEIVSRMRGPDAGGHCATSRRSRT